MSANARQEDFLFAEHVLRRGFATEEQVQECLRLLERMRGELELDETLEHILATKGYLAQAQAQVIRRDINPEEAGRAKNQIEGYQLLVRLGSASAPATNASSFACLISSKEKWINGPPCPPVKQDGSPNKPANKRHVRLAGILRFI